MSRHVNNLGEWTKHMENGKWKMGMGEAVAEP
jgi:hypothetical protein